MANPVELLVSRLQAAVTQPEERRDAYASSLDHALALSVRLPLVHRTARPGQAAWTAILRERGLKRTPVGSAGERAAGHDEALYFFVGSGAYPHGELAFFFDLSLAEEGSVEPTFTPFDSGGLAAGFMQTWDDGAEIAHRDRGDLFALHVGDGKDVGEYTGHHIAAHLRDPQDYVRRPLVSQPDFPPAHGFVSRTGHRLAWTVEVQVHDDVSLDGWFLAVAAGRRDRILELPDDLIGLATYPSEAEGELGESDFDAHIASVVLGMIS